MDQRDIGFIHDIGKLVDWDALGLRDGPDPHNFETCAPEQWGFDPEKAPWRSIREHHSQKQEEGRRTPLRLYPSSDVGLLACIADNMASGLAREKVARSDPAGGLYCLWTGETSKWSPLSSCDQLRELIAFINTCPSSQAITDRYGSLLAARPEDLEAGSNVTTLQSHSSLAGKFFAILHQHYQADIATDFAPSSVDEACQVMEAKQNRWKMTVARLSVVFPQRPYRTRDLSVFEARREALTELVAAWPDNILAQFGDQLIAVFSDDDQFKHCTGQLLESGFFVDTTHASVGIGELAGGAETILGTKHKRVTSQRLHLPLPDEIPPPICENCQMAPADKQWAIESETPVAAEELCHRCYELRSRAETLHKLASWSEGYAVWARTHLDLDLLPEALSSLHRDYIRSVAKRIDSEEKLEQLQVRFPLLADFSITYAQALTNWREAAIQRYGDNRVEIVDDDLLCVSVDRRVEALGLLQIHSELLNQHFPKLAELPLCPVRMAMSVGPVKHPFSSHWRFLQEPDNDVQVLIIGSGTATLPACRLDQILQVMGREERRAAHRLREIAKTSKALAQLVLTHEAASGQRHSQAYRKLSQILPLGLDFESLLVLAELAEPSGEK